LRGVVDQQAGFGLVGGDPGLADACSDLVQRILGWQFHRKVAQSERAGGRRRGAT
jgi:hypothetical protein